MPNKLPQRRNPPSSRLSTYLDTARGDEAEFLRELRDIVHHSGATYETVTEAAGVYPTCLTRWFCGRTVPTIRILCPLLRTLGYRLAIVPLEDPAVGPR